MAETENQFTVSEKVAKASLQLLKEGKEKKKKKGIFRHVVIGEQKCSS